MNKDLLLSTVGKSLSQNNPKDCYFIIAHLLWNLRGVINMTKIEMEDLLYEHRQLVAILRCIQMAISEGASVNFGEDDAIWYVERKLLEINEKLYSSLVENKGKKESVA